MRLPVAVALGLLLLGACSRSGDDTPGAVSTDEAAQLNDAAAMLDANSIDLDAVHASENESTVNAR